MGFCNCFVDAQLFQEFVFIQNKKQKTKIEKYQFIDDNSISYDGTSVRF